jgi:hypothetical protein
VLLGGVALAPFGDAAQGSSVGCNDGTVSWSPDAIWPPNHKLHDIGIVYDDGDDDATRLTIDAITHDQFVEDAEGNVEEMNGSGNPTLVDMFGAGNTDTGSGEDNAAVSAQVRGERSGRDQTGRVYTITVTCQDYLPGGALPDPSGQESDGEGGTEPNPDGAETVNLTVFIPHDLGNHNGQQ